MKKIFLLFAVFCFLSSLNAQISLQNTYVGDSYPILIKLQNSGYKYQRYLGGSTIELYNLNHSLFKTITIPTVTGSVMYVSYVSESLFNTDNLVEYAIVTTTVTGSARYRTYIFNENGAPVFQRDSAVLPNASNGSVFFNQDGVFWDGVAAKMRLQVYSGITAPQVIKTLVYTLPGTIPCVECSSSGTVVGISNPGSTNPVNATFYPNPVTDQLKLKYDLPKDYKSAEIRVFDMQGKLIDTYKVTDTFDFIYLPSDYNNGLYLYSLNVDGVTIKTEKIILDK